VPGLKASSAIPTENAAPEGSPDFFPRTPAPQSLASDVLPDIGLKLDSPMANVMADEYADRLHKKQHQRDHHHMHEDKQEQEQGEEERQQNQPQPQSQAQSQSRQQIPPIPSIEPQGQQLPTTATDRHRQIKHQKRVSEHEHEHEHDPNSVAASDATTPAGFKLRTPTDDQPAPHRHAPEELPLTGWAKLGLVLAALFALVLVVIVTTLIRSFINRGKEYEPLVDRQLQQQHNKDHYTASHHATTTTSSNKQRV